jgi:hypothetical protein
MSKHESAKSAGLYSKVAQISSEKCPFVEAEIIQGGNSSPIKCPFSKRCKGTLNVTGAQAAVFDIKHCEYLFRENATAAEGNGEFGEGVELPSLESITYYKRTG